MTTNMQSKFRTDFSTLGELWEIWLSPPEEIKAWAELLVPEQLEIGNENNRTVAHQLAACGALPAKFLTPEILWIADESDNTVAGDYTAWAAENNRWDLMIPELLEQPGQGETTISPHVGFVLILIKWKLSDMRPEERLDAISRIPQKTKSAILSLITDSASPLSVAIRRSLDRDTEKSVFERGVSSAQDIEEVFPEEVPLWENDNCPNLYGAGRGA